MKNLLLMLLFLSGIAATEINAQACCKSSLPACCVTTCTPEQQKNCTPEQMKNCTTEQQKACSPEQMKACSKTVSNTTKKLATTCCANAKKDAAVETNASQLPTEARPAEASAILVKN